MKTLRLLALAALAGIAMIAVGGCNPESTRAVLTIQSINDGNAYLSDLINTADSNNIFIPVDRIVVTLGNIQNDGGAPLAPGSPFSDIILTGYSVVYDNGIYSPVYGGLSGHVASGGSTQVSIFLSNTEEKVALLSSLSGTVPATALITINGFVQANGGNNGDPVHAIGRLSVQVGNFADKSSL